MRRKSAYPNQAYKLYENISLLMILLLLLTAELTVFIQAEEVVIESEAGGTTSAVSANDKASDDNDSDLSGIIEDSGFDDVSNTLGVSMDTLQEAMDEGDSKKLEKIASLGALTGENSDSSSSSGGSLDGGAASRSDPVDEDIYSSLSLDTDDADDALEEESELDESPSALMAASSDRIQQTLDDLADIESTTGSEGELEAASYIESIMTGLGYTVQEQPFHEGVLNEEGVDEPGINILAERGANSQQNRKDDIFLIVTHYDSKRSPQEDDPFANDKSGVASLLEAGRIVANVITDTDVCFLFLSGQEDGGYGAQSFIESLSDENRERITGVLAVERIGYDTDTPYVLKTLTGEGNFVGDLVQRLGITNDQLVLSEQEEEEELNEVAQALTLNVSDAEIIDNSGLLEDLSGIENIGDDDGQSDDEFLSADDEEQSEMESMANNNEDMPSAWSYLKDSLSAQSTFASESFIAVTLSQYMPELDISSYEETKDLGLANTTASIIAQERTSSYESSAEEIVMLEDADFTGSEDGLAEDSDGLTGEGAASRSLEEETAETGDVDGKNEVDGGEEDAYETEASENGLDDVEWDDSWNETPEADSDLIAQTTDVIAAALAIIMDSSS